MSETPETHVLGFLELAADITSAYVSNNSIRPTDLPDLIRSIHTALGSISPPLTCPTTQFGQPICRT
ncbi:MucR family transcriptional regulator [Methylobacterium sp. Leaf113]|uniref:MucR family transcriptional regulator n=1 Tax=Methylobacterium sp. Leaf113 TaxID=1736259 RepID=UPI0009EAF53A